MDLLKRIFSGDKLSSYEKEQKRRYKQYVKLGTTSTIVMSKSESEIYQDYLIRKSLRRSKRKASAMKAQNEDIFKETNTNPGLSAAPAVLDAVNRNVSITNVPNDYLNDLKEMETITTVQTHIPNSHSTQERPQSTQFEGNATALESTEADPAPITTTEPLDEKFAFGNQEKFLNQLDEVIRNRSKDQPRGSTTSTASTLSTTPSSPLYENTKDLEGQFLSVPVAKPRKKVERSWKKANRHSDNVESYAAKQQEQMDEISTITHTIQLPTDSQENSEDTYQTESMEEIVWGTPPSNLLPMSRSNSCITTQSEDSFFDCISEDDDIYDDEEKKIMKQISPPFRERKESYNDPETDFRSLGSEEGLEQDSLQPPRYDSIIKDEKYIQHQEVNNAPNNPESIQHKLETSNNISEDIIEPDSLEMQIELPTPTNNLAPKLKIIDVERQVEPERQVEIEHVDGVEREDVSELESKSKPEAKERNINNMTSWMERVRMKERDFVSTEFSKEKVREHEEVQIQDEALLLDEHYHNFKDDPEFLKIPESHRANKNHLIKLENNNDYTDISIESDRADGKKVTFDFAKSYCQTYEVDDDIDNGDEDETTSSIRIGENRVLNPIDDELYLEDHYRRPSKMQRHNLENLYIPTDDRTRVFLSYGIQPTPTPEEEIIDKIFESSINMDLAFLNCVDGFEVESQQLKPKNSVKIVELPDKDITENQEQQSNSKLETRQNEGPFKNEAAFVETVVPDIHEDPKQSLPQHNWLIDIENVNTVDTFKDEDIKDVIFIEPPPSFASTEVNNSTIAIEGTNEGTIDELSQNTSNNMPTEPSPVPQEINQNPNIDWQGPYRSNTDQAIIDDSQPIDKTSTITNQQSLILDDIVVNNFTSRTIDDTLSHINENDTILEPQTLSKEIYRNSPAENSIFNEVDSLVPEENETEYYEVINPAIEVNYVNSRYHLRSYERPSSLTSSLSVVTNSNNNEIGDEQNSAEHVAEFNKLSNLNTNPNDTEDEIPYKNLNSLTKSSALEYKPYLMENHADKHNGTEIKIEAERPSSLTSSLSVVTNSNNNEIGDEQNSAEHVAEFNKLSNLNTNPNDTEDEIPYKNLNSLTKSSALEYKPYLMENHADKHNGTEIKIEADPPENRIDMEANDEVHNSYNNNASRLALSLENPPIPEVSEDTPKYSRYNMSKPTSNISLGRSTSESTLNKYKARRPDIYSNRNVFTSNARKPLIRSTSHSFGYDTSQKFNVKGIDGERKESLSQTSSNCDFPEVEGNSIQSLSEIQRRLSEVRNIEAAETQLQQIQNILVNVKQRADMLESKTEDEYVHLLQTLFKSIRIVSGLQCNFDQDLLESQQKTLKDIKDCISYLNTK